MKTLLALGLLIALSFAAPPRARATDPALASPAGLWAPINSDSGKPDGLIRIFESHGLYYGRIEPSSPTDDRRARCTQCTGSRHNQPIIGLVIMRHLKPADGQYVGGDILNPNDGRVYRCSLRLIDGGRKLLMHGYIGIPLLGRSEVWVRMTGTPGGTVRPYGR